MINFEENINKLPSLPTLVYDLKSLNNKNNLDSEKLLKIIESDSLLRTKFLKLANSKLFGFENSIDTVSRTIHLYGMNFSLSLAIAQGLKNILKVNLDAYDCSFERFEFINELSCFLLFSWFDEDEVDLQERLVLPLLVHGLGRFLISDHLIKESKLLEFTALLKQSSEIYSVEKSLIGTSCSEVTAKILERWHFEKSLVNLVLSMDNPLEHEENKDVQILHIIKIVCDINDPFSKKSIELAFQRADMYNLDVLALKKAIELTMKYFEKGK